MSIARTLGLAALALGSIALVGCGDADGDGLSNSKEKKFGSDKDVADSDGDGVDDGAEVDQGLNPALADSDGDGYTDGDELHAGTDPLDVEDVIYKGGWPYNRNKDAIADPGLAGPTRAGDLVPRVKVRDQFGDSVDLYDFAGHGKPILIDVSAQWCGPCNGMASWMDNGTYWQSNGYGWLSDFNGVRRAVNNDQVYWVTFIAEDFNFGDAKAQTVREWYEEYPHEQIPVLVDREKQFTEWMGLQGYPTTMWVNEDMTIEYLDTDAVYDALDRLNSSL